jgi:hemolysin D
MPPSIVSRQGSMKSANKIVAFPPERAKSRHREEIAFLPAALEIVETPPSPIGRAIGATIIAVFGFALAWACLGTVDIVAMAPGKIIPSGRTKIIQPFETGVVRAIHVQDGQSVKAGDVLIELDPTMSGAELGHLKSDLVSAQLDAARLRAAIAGHDDPLADFKPPQGATPDLIEMHRRFLISQTAEQNSKLAAIDRQVGQKEAERATVDATINKLDATIPLLQERVDVRKQLYQKELSSKLLYLTELQDLVGQQQDLLVQKSKSREADAAIAALVETRTKTAAEYQRSLFDDLAKAEQKAAGLVQDVVKAEQKTNLQRLTAPVDGVVQQLAAHTVGGVVTPAQALMTIVPLESHFEIEAMVSNRDIGFIEAGQGAAIKVDTFNFTRYGLLHGKVLSISHDAITREKPQDKTTDRPQGTESSSSEPKGQELIYAARVSLDHAEMQIDDKLVNLSPGMAVTVEIKTGSRRIISYLLSPLVRYTHESLRER